MAQAQEHVTINIRAKAGKRDLIDQAADRLGQRRSTFMLEAACTRHFHMPQPLRTLARISADILAVKKEAEGLLDGLLVEATPP